MANELDEMTGPVNGAGRDGNVHPTLAGLVCFGDFNEITNVLPYFFLDYREHLSPDVRWTDRVCSITWGGTLRRLIPNLT